jgi:hypothetical protein
MNLANLFGFDGAPGAPSGPSTGGDSDILGLLGDPRFQMLANVMAGIHNANQPGATVGQALFGGLAQGLNNQAKMQGAQQEAEYRNALIAESRRRREQEENKRQAAARLARRLTNPNASYVRHPQMASADPNAPSAPPPFDLAEAARDPVFMADWTAAGRDPVSLITAMQKEDQLVSVAPGASLVNRRTGQPVYTNPRSDRLTELNTLFELAGIPEGDPRRAQFAAQILERKGQPMQTKVELNLDPKRNEAVIQADRGQRIRFDAQGNPIQ